MAAAAIDIRKVARTFSQVENGRPGSQQILREAYGLSRHVPVVGIAGPPGAGKSTLVDWLAAHWADQAERVAVIAIDPSSPYTGGAVLGDRFRMNRASAHPGVFLRSLSSRGQVGGLSRAVGDLVVVAAALGFDRVIVETVGSGQADVDVAGLADCVVVVSVPGLGDQLQAGKAGILEIGDIYAVNKCDLPGADSVAGHLSANLDLVYPGTAGINAAAAGAHGQSTANAALCRRHGRIGEGSAWRPPVLKLNAAKGEGVAALTSAVDQFLAWQEQSGHAATRRAERSRDQLLRLAQGRLLALAEAAELAPLAAAVAQGSISPGQGADRLVDGLCAAWRQQRQEHAG